MILTDANGRPIERPTPPPAGAPVEDVITFQRALAAFNDRAADLANSSFARAFAEGVRR